MRDNCERRKKPCHTKLCVFETSYSKSEVSKSNSLKITFFLEIYITSEGAVSHTVLYYQPLPFTRYQLTFYANNYFEYFHCL